MIKPITIELDNLIEMGINDACIVLKEVVEGPCAACSMDSKKDRFKLRSTFKKALRKAFERRYSTYMTELTER